jgi:hypothetical protein
MDTGFSFGRQSGACCPRLLGAILDRADQVGAKVNTSGRMSIAAALAGTFARPDFPNFPSIVLP